MDTCIGYPTSQLTVTDRLIDCSSQENLQSRYMQFNACIIFEIASSQKITGHRPGPSPRVPKTPDPKTPIQNRISMINIGHWLVPRYDYACV
jgi:hypothetical protein